MSFITSTQKSMEKKKMNVRNEFQEYPNKPLEEAFVDKLKDASNNSDNTFSIGT